MFCIYEVLTQKQQIHKQCCYNHKETSKNEHGHKISCSATKRIFFQHSTISIGKNQIEEKIKAKRSIKQKCGH